MEKPPTALILYAAALLTSFNKSGQVRNQSLKLSFGLIHVFQQDHDWTLNRCDSINTLIAVKVVVYRSHRRQARVTKKKKKKLNLKPSLAHTVNQMSQRQHISGILKRWGKILTVFLLLYFLCTKCKYLLVQIVADSLCTLVYSSTLQNSTQ